MTGLRVVNNQIRNQAGNAIQLVGVNRSGFEYPCEEGWGIVDGPVDLPQVLAMKTWNINVVRLPLNEDCWLGINGVNPSYSGPKYQYAVANFVALLTSHDIAVVLNLHFSAPGSTLATNQAPMADRDHSNTFWTEVATAYKSNSAVIFEPYNEPHPADGADTTLAWTCWRDGGTCPGVGFTAAGMQEMVNAIRATGATNIIVLTGNDWGSQLTRWLTYRPLDPLNQLVAGWHSYGDGLDCQSVACWDTVLGGVLQHVPILATEIGEHDCNHTYIDQVMGWLDGRGQGYLAWNWGPFDCARDPALLMDWSGVPTKNYGQPYRDHLLSRPCVDVAPTTVPPCELPAPTRRPSPVGLRGTSSNP